MCNQLYFLLIITILFLTFSVSSSKSDDKSNSCGCDVKRSTISEKNDPPGSKRMETDEVVTTEKTDIETQGMECKSDVNYKSDRKLRLEEEDMVLINGRKFYIGTDSPKIAGDGEGPRRLVIVSSFMMDRYEVSNNWYQQFVEETQYKTDSEIYGWSFVFDKAVAESLRNNITQAVHGAKWWLPVNGSYWREPEGPGTDVFDENNNRGDYPAVHISWTDAVKFCEWRKARLPTEAEWELAARGEKDGLVFPWGNKLQTDGVFRANIFQGSFPKNNTAADGHEFLAPINAYEPQTDGGLHNMIGNAWEWVSDWWIDRHDYDIGAILDNPTGPIKGEEKVKKGGSFICHKKFCYRYRNAARSKTSIDSAAQNSGFRCAKDLD
jgi:formylglycine-generating enzyme